MTFYHHSCTVMVRKAAGCLKMQQIFFEPFNKYKVNIHFNNVSFVSANLSTFFPGLWLGHDQLSSNSGVLKEFLNSNLLVLIYFSRLTIRIITLLVPRSTFMNLTQSFLVFFSYLVSPVASPNKLIESEVPPALQVYSFTYKRFLYPVGTNLIHLLRKQSCTKVNYSSLFPHGDEQAAFCSSSRNTQILQIYVTIIPKHCVFNPLKKNHLIQQIKNGSRM